MTNNKTIYFIAPILLSSALIGCSKVETPIAEQSSRVQNQVQTQAQPVEKKIEFSEVFKENFLDVVAQYNNMDEFKENYKSIEWDYDNNAPVLPDAITIKEYSDNTISFDVTKKLTDLEMEFVSATYKLMELYKKLDSLSENNNYEDTAYYEEYKKFLNEYESLSYKYYESRDEDIDSSEKSHNLTLTGKCLVYSMLGGGKEVHDAVNEGFYMLNIIASMIGMVEEDEYTKFLLNNIYIAKNDEEVYGKLSYDRNVDLDNKEFTQTFTFKKYSEEMAKEIKELQKKLDELDI